MHYHARLQFQKCALDKVLTHLSNDECIETIKNEVNSIYAIISAMNDSIILKYFDKTIILFNSLIKMCSPACNTCPKYKNINYIIKTNLKIKELDLNIKLP